MYRNLERLHRKYFLAGKNAIINLTQILVLVPYTGISYTCTRGPYSIDKFTQLVRFQYKLTRRSRKTMESQQAARHLTATSKAAEPPLSQIDKSRNLKGFRQVGQKRPILTTECDECKKIFPEDRIILVPGKELILCADCHWHYATQHSQRDSSSALLRFLSAFGENALSQAGALTASLVLALTILHAAFFRFDETFYLLTHNYDHITGFTLGLALIGSMMYLIALPWMLLSYNYHSSSSSSSSSNSSNSNSSSTTLKWAFVVVPFLMTAVLLLKRDMDRNLLIDYSPGRLLQGRSNIFAGKVVLITGANSGVGLSTTKYMFRLGATVVMGCRSLKKCQKAAALIYNDLDSGSLVPMELDLASFRSIHSFADSYISKYRRLDILFANAGFASAPENGNLQTEDGLELGLGTMHFGHFLLFQRLRYTLEKTARAPHTDVRVVVTSSAASQYAFLGAQFHDSLFDEPPGDIRGEITSVSTGLHYGRAKLANVLFVHHLQKVIPWITACACHVGAVDTSIWVAPHKYLQRFVDFYTSLIMRSPDQASRILLKCALSRSVDVWRSGAYLNGMGAVVIDEEMSPNSRNSTLARRLWQVSEDIAQSYNIND